MTTPNSCAFPIYIEGLPPEFGLTKREYFAAIAMQGILANSECMGLRESEIAHCAVANADALIQELSGENKND